MKFSTSGTKGHRKEFELTDQQKDARVANISTCRPSDFLSIKSIAVAGREETSSAIRYSWFMASRGGKYIQLPTGSAHAMAEAIVATKPDAIIAGSSLLLGLAKLVRGRHRAIFAMCGGVALNPHHVDEIRDGLCSTVWNTYSTSEVGTISFASGFEVKATPGYVGKPRLGVEVRYVDGLVQVKTPTMFSGVYVGETESVLVDGWFPTGDKGHAAPDGGIILAQA